MSDVLNAVVIGVGALGQHHARIYATNEKTRLAAVVDTDPEARDRIASKWGCQSLASLDEVTDRIDVASIVVPTSAHYACASHLIEKGVPVLVEKPITLTVDEGNRLIQLAHKRNVPLQVGHIERFNPAIIALRNHLKHPLFIESHRLGPPAPRVKDIGVVLDLMIHDIDLILTLVDSDVADIDAVGIPIINQQEDIANGRIKFESGCTANLTVSRVTPERQRKIRFFQRDTYLSLDFIKSDLQIYRKATSQSGATSIEREKPEITKQEPLALEIDAFINSILNKTTPEVTGEDGVRALKLAQHITEQVHQVSQRFLREFS